MIYLDNAATTLEKPPEVATSVSRAIGSLASAGRGGHSAALEAANVMFKCREAVGELFNVDNPERVVFTLNATHGLNIAIKSLISPGDKAVISGYEHNAVLRPLHALGAKIKIAESDLFEPEVCVSKFDRMIDGSTKAVVINHVSNVFGYIQPVERVAEICRKRGVPLIIDASQSAGCIELDFQALGAAFIAMPGHKGLYGPQGTGVLICGENTKPIMEGGTGSESLLPDMPSFLPDRLEAGTQSACGIAGLLEGVKYVLKRGAGAILDHEKNLIALAAEYLEDISGLKVFYSPYHGVYQTGVLSFIARGIDSEKMGAALGERGIAVRAGLHCAPLAHKTAETVDTGTVRVSVSDFNTEGEIRRFARNLKQILQQQ